MSATRVSRIARQKVVQSEFGCLGPRVLFLSLIGLAVWVGSGASIASPVRLSGTLGHAMSSPESLGDGLCATAILSWRDWSLSGSTTWTALFDSGEASSSLTLALERADVALTTHATFSAPFEKCASLSVGLPELDGSWQIRESDPAIDVEVEASLGTAVIPRAEPYGSLATTLRVDDHWLRYDAPSQLTGSLSLLRLPVGDGAPSTEVSLSALFPIDLALRRVKRVSLDAAWVGSRTTIMLSAVHSRQLPLALGVALYMNEESWLLSITASIAPTAERVLRVAAKWEYAWRAF